ncbi:MAG: DUF2304 domain-containing protein [Nitrospirae bacterium]|nr:DUF2304 domain-containing protein [Nitrospirota bacterium]
MIIIAQILLLSLVALALGLVILRYRQRKIDAFGFFLWMALWGGAATVIVFPDSTLVVAHLFGIGRGVDLVLYVSIILILYLLFRVYVRLEQLDREITQVVRALALREEGPVHSREKQDGASEPSDRRP